MFFVYCLILQLPHEAAVESQAKEHITELSEHMLKTNIKVGMAHSLSFFILIVPLYIF